MDDGADLITMLHTKRKELMKKVLGGTEETTTGVIRFRAMEKDRALKFPVVAVNDAKTKHMFDNFYGTGQSTIDGILRATNALISGTYFVVAGYGWCSRGIAMRAHGMGAKVIVTEVDSVRALQAAMDGFTVMTMSRAARVGDIFVTATGCNDILRKEHFKAMKDGAILANSGHFNVEINISDLRNGNRIYLLGEGRLINLAAAEGHPSEVMDMSFANQALCAEHIAKNRSKLRIKLYSVPEDIDKRIASMKLHSMGMSLDRLTPLQKKYLGSWQEGT